VCKIDLNILPFLSQEQRRALKEGAGRHPGIVVDASRDQIAAMLAGMTATPDEIRALQQAAMAKAVANRIEAGFRPDLANAGAIYNDAQREDDPPPPFKIRPFNPSGQRTHKPSTIILTPSPFKPHDPAKFPRRQFLYGRHFARKYMSTTISAGDVGKTTLALAEAVAMALHNPIMGVYFRQALSFTVS
jgi:hypothetical protein